jgi:hypothetical protein
MKLPADVNERGDGHAEAVAEFTARCAVLDEPANGG